MTTYVFKATVQEDEDGRWSALVDDLPGCTTWACSQEGALDALQDARNCTWNVCWNTVTPSLI